MKRALYAAVGLVAVALGIAVIAGWHASWWQFAVLAIAPDVTLVMGAAPGLHRGQLNPPAVPFYNAVHRLAVPAILIALTFLLHQNGWLAGGLAWAAHIAFDRSLGFGLRNAQGFQREPPRATY